MERANGLFEAELSVFEAKIKSLERAEHDAGEAVAADSANAKAHFRLGAAQHELAARGACADKRTMLESALASLRRSDELMPKVMATKNLIAEATSLLQRLLPGCSVGSRKPQ